MHKDIQIFQDILGIIVSEIKIILKDIPIEYKKSIEEIRLRNRSPLAFMGLVMITSLISMGI